MKYVRAYKGFLDFRKGLEAKPHRDSCAQVALGVGLRRQGGERTRRVPASSREHFGLAVAVLTLKEGGDQLRVLEVSKVLAPPRGQAGSGPRRSSRRKQTPTFSSTEAAPHAQPYWFQGLLYAARKRFS